MNRQLLEKINQEGNRFPFQHEAVEDWSPDMYRKDCDSYASWKYLKCKEAGVSHKHLAICTVSTEGSDVENHAVLAVYAADDDCVYILDNRLNAVHEWQWFADWGYRYIRVPVYMSDLMAGKLEDDG